MAPSQSLSMPSRHFSMAPGLTSGLASLQSLSTAAYPSGAAQAVVAVSVDPDADPARPAFARDVEAGEGGDDPCLQIAHEAAHVGAAALQIQHHIGDPLARPVVGVLAAAPAAVDGKARRLDEVVLLGRRAGGVERRVLQQPHHLRRLTGADGGDPSLHDGDRARIVHEARFDAPLDGGRFHVATAHGCCHDFRLNSRDI